jgi:hypothetical protein
MLIAYDPADMGIWGIGDTKEDAISDASHNIGYDFSVVYRFSKKTDNEAVYVIDMTLPDTLLVIEASPGVIAAVAKDGGEVVFFIHDGKAYLKGEAVA